MLANLAFFIVIALGHAQGVGKSEDVVDIFGFVAQIPVAGGIEGFGIMVPGGRGVLTVATKEEFDHVAFHAGLVGGGAVPEVVVGESDGACFDDDGHLSPNVCISGHAVGGGIAKLGAGHNDRGTHVGCDVGGIIKAQKAVDAGVASVDAVLVPLHMA